MKKRSLSFFLALCLLLLSACGRPDGNGERAAAGLQSVKAAEPSLPGQTPASPFSDVPAGADYAGAVAWCRERGVLNGVGGGRFDPSGTLTRAMLVTALYRAEGEPPVANAPSFTDTQADAWYASGVAWANGKGLVKGYGSGLFGTNDPVSVEQLELILGRYAGEAPAWKGDPAKARAATRAEVAVALYHALNKEEEEPMRETGKILVAYFSATGTTKALAETIQAATGGDLFEIAPAEPYTSADLNYNTDCRANREQNDPAARPALAANCTAIDAYDTVFLGYPIWWGIPPKITRTFVESHDLDGKTVIPFCTSGGGGFSDEGLPDLAPGADWREGKRLNGASRSEVEAWVAGLGLPAADEPENPGKFDLAAQTVTLNSGYEMPINGLGTYSLHGDECVGAVKAALRSGVRLFDTASAYGNETEVGQALREGMEELGIAREEIFVITKIYPGSEMADPETSIQACLDRLGLGYVDMMLLHHPDSNDVKAYKAMEKFAEEGKIRSLGLSNWYVKELESFLPQVTVKPALVQNEIHPYYQENDVIPYIQEQGITVQGWYPLGGRGHTGELLGDETISAIARAHGVSAAQVILRWNLQKGVVVIPGSSNPSHIQENTELYHFELTEAEMARINALDRKEKHDWY